MTTLATFRPRSALEIVDGAFTLFREHFATLVAISAIVRLPFAIIAAIVPPEFANLVDRGGNLFVAIGLGATAVLIHEALSGREIELGDAFRGIKVSFGTLVLTQILAGLMIAFGVLLLVIPGIIAFVWTAVAVPAAAIERQTASDALSRSRELSRSNGWHVLGTMLLAWGALIIVGIAGTVGVGFIVGALGISDRIGEFLGQLIFIVLLPLVSVATTLLYIDLRVRREGLDVEATLDMIASRESVSTM